MKTINIKSQLLTLNILSAPGLEAEKSGAHQHYKYIDMGTKPG